MLVCCIHKEFLKEYTKKPTVGRLGNQMRGRPTFVCFLVLFGIALWCGLEFQFMTYMSYF